MPFLIDTVLPTLGSGGLYVDGPKYAVKIKNTSDVICAGHPRATTVFVLGDSANNYPPGFSLDFGLSDARRFLLAFFGISFRDRRFCDAGACSQLYGVPNFPDLKLKLVGGYPGLKDSAENSCEKTVDQVLQIIGSSLDV